jgi:hypothetical protein
MNAEHDFEDLEGNELTLELGVSYKVVETIVEYGEMLVFTHRCEYWLPEKAPDTIEELLKE